MATTEKELLAFAMKLAGGEEAVKQEFIKSRLMNSISGGATIGSIIAQAESEGWLETLKGVRFADLLGMGRGKKKESGGRLTKVDKEVLLEAILKHLEAHPWVSKGSIAEAVGFDPLKVGAQLMALKKTGQIKSHGEKANMTYAIKGEKTKP